MHSSNTYYAMMYQGMEIYIHIFLTLALRWRWSVSIMHWQFYPQEKIPNPLTTIG